MFLGDIKKLFLVIDLGLLTPKALGVLTNGFLVKIGIDFLSLNVLE